MPTRVNEASPLEMGPADLGRFVLLPIDAYPTLKQPRRKGQTHVGWALRITEVSKTRVWLVDQIWPAYWMDGLPYFCRSSFLCAPQCTLHHLFHCALP